MAQRGTTLQGYDATLALFKKYAATAEPRAGQIMRGFAFEILHLSLQYCPKETGALRASARVLSGDTSTTWTVAYGAGGGLGYRDTYYAVFVHEIPKANYTEPGTGWKYLQRATDEVFPRMISEFPKKFAGVSFGAVSYTGEFLPPG